MNQQEFEAGLRKHLHREPFLPFVVELLDGRVITITQRTLAFGDAAERLEKGV